MTRDAKLIRADFNIPKFSSEFSYLKNYFQTSLPICFVKYYFEFNEMLSEMSIEAFCLQFIDHSGMCCSTDRLRYLLKRIILLTNLEKKATIEFDLDTLMIIKDGKFRFEH